MKSYIILQFIALIGIASALNYLKTDFIGKKANNGGDVPIDYVEEYYNMPVSLVIRKRNFHILKLSSTCHKSQLSTSLRD